MKLTKSQLKQIIKEELESTIEEGALHDFLWGKSRVSTFDPAGGEEEETEYTIVFQTPSRTEIREPPDGPDIWDDGRPMPRLGRPADVAPSGLQMEWAIGAKQLNSKIEALPSQISGVNFIVAYETETRKIVRTGAANAIKAVLDNPVFNKTTGSPLYKWSSDEGPPPDWAPQIEPPTRPMKKRKLEQIIKEELVQVLRESQRAA